MPSETSGASQSHRTGRERRRRSRGLRRMIRRWKERHTSLHLRHVLFYLAAMATAVGVSYSVSHCEVADSAGP